MEIPFYRPFLPSYEKVEVEFRDAYERGMLAPSKYTKRMERAFEDYLNVKHVVAFSNCADAMMCLVGYIKDLTGKNKVIIPGFTFAATWQAVDWNGMEAVVVDTDETGLISPREVEKALNYCGEDVACVLGVHLWGQCAHNKILEELALKYKTYLIYDAAHGIGSRINGVPLANNGLADVFSLGTTKTLAAGEGGLVSTNEDRLAEAMRRAAQHGHKVGELDVEVKSLNGRIQEINSIIAYHSLGILDENVSKRVQVADTYNINLKEHFSQGNVVKPVYPGIRASYKDYTIFLNAPINQLYNIRNRFKNSLEKRGVPTKTYYYPAVVDLFSFRGKVISSSIARRLAFGCLSLPFFTEITEEQQKFVIAVFNEELDRLNDN